jgi:hypothetical protein
MNVTVEIDTSRAMRELELTAQGLRGLTVEALNATVLAAKDEAVRRLADIFQVTTKTTRFGVTTEPATVAAPVATIQLRGLLIPVRKLSPIQTPTGVAYSAPGGTFGEVRHAFIASMRRGSRGGVSLGVFRRTTRPAERRGPKRSYLPIKQQVARVRPFVPEGLTAWIARRLEEDLRRQLFFRGLRASAGSLPARVA